MLRWTTCTLSMLRDAVLVAAIAVVAFQALRRWGGDRYRVPSDSMEPVLHGDPANGDIVFVDKLASRRNCRRHDLVVVRHPLEPGQQLVKRIAASGDEADACWIDLRDGDVWLGPDAQRLHRETKDPIEARTMRVPWAQWPAAAVAAARLLDLQAATVESQALVLPPLGKVAGELRVLFADEARWQRRRDAAGRAAPAGCLGTARAVDATYVDAAGERDKAGDDVGMQDCGMDLTVLDLPAGLLGTIDTREEALTFHWQPATGRLELWRNGEDVEVASLPAVAGGPHRLEFGRLDDRVFFVVDGGTEASFCKARRPEWNVADGRPGLVGGPRCHVYVGATGDRPLRLSAVTVFHDVHRWRERIAGLPGREGEWPRFVGPGSWFLLGDNAFDSRDSRNFDAVPSDLFVGRPWFVLGPWPRGRWLQP